MADSIADQYLNGPSPGLPAPAAASSSDIANQFLGNTPNPETNANAIDQSLANYDALQGQYGTLPQQILTGVEQGAQGVIGPIAPAIEEATGLTTGKDIRAREEANPSTGGISKFGTFLGSSLLTPELKPFSLLGGVTSLGNLVEHGALPLLPKLVATGVKTGAEMAALSTSDELSKMITGAYAGKSPSEALGTAAIHVGLNGLMGVVGGPPLEAGIGYVSSLFGPAKQQATEKALADAMAWTDKRAQMAAIIQDAIDAAGRPGAVEENLNNFLNRTPNKEFAEEYRNSAATSAATTAAEAAAEAASEGAKAEAPEKKSGHIEDFSKEQKFMAENPNQVDAVTSELTGRLKEADDMWKTMSETKPEVLQQTMPEFSEENSVKIDQQIQEIADQVGGKIAQAAQSVKTKSAVPYLAEDYNNFLERVSRPNATYVDKFAAANDLKTTLQGYAKWGLTEESTAKGALGQELSQMIRPLLENEKVWGAAGRVQSVTNKAIAEAIEATKNIRGQVLDRSGAVDPVKVNSLVNQTNAGKISRKANVVADYLEKTNGYSKAIDVVHRENGLEVPLSSKLNPTPVLDHVLNTELTPGVKLARFLHDKGARIIAGAIGKSASGVVGGLVGSLVGHPIAGAIASEQVLAPIFTALAKPFLERPVNAVAAKAAFDYVSKVQSGMKALNFAVDNMFKPGVEVIAKDLIPDQKSRNKLQKSLDAFQSSPDNAMKIGGNLDHYLPIHSTALAQMSAQASNYLESLRPKQMAVGPLDAAPPVDKAAQAKYNRALDIAQQPLLVIKHVKDGTLLPQDVQTLQNIYPALHATMVNKITSAMIDHISNGGTVPYAQRVSLNTLIGGAPLDSTMGFGAAQAIMHSATQQQSGQQAQSHKKSSSGAVISQLNKVDSMYNTSLEQRQIDKKQ